jgi:hypothetical protein
MSNNKQNTALIPVSTNNLLENNTKIEKYGNIPYYYITMPTFKTFENKNRLKAVILDNDETTGYYKKLENYIKQYNKSTSLEKTIDEIVEKIKFELLEKLNNINSKKTSLRPGIEDFLKDLLNLKRTGKIDAIIMYTNMSKNSKIIIDNKVYSKPYILALIFNKIAEVTPEESFFDLLIFRDKSYPKTKYIKVIDIIFKVKNKDNVYLFFDDKPGEIKYKNKNTNNESNSINIKLTIPKINEYIPYTIKNMNSKKITGTKRTRKNNNKINNNKIMTGKRMNGKHFKNLTNKIKYNEIFLF